MHRVLIAVRRADLRIYPQGVKGVCALTALGWNESWQRVSSCYPALGAPGRVAGVDRGLCLVITEAGLVRASLGPEVLTSMVDDPTVGPCTGDWCVVRTWCDGPCTVEEVLPRRTTIGPLTASGGSGQLLAANATIAAVVVALHPTPEMAWVERLFALARGSGATPVVVLTKTDVVADVAAVAEGVIELAGDAIVICTSAVDGRGIEQLRALAARGTLALIGSSGHGKSALAKALVGTDVLPTGSPRAACEGEGTSVRRQLTSLPGGGCVVDTPGLAAVGFHRQLHLGVEPPKDW